MGLPSALGRHANKIRWTSIAVSFVALLIVMRALPLARGMDLLEGTLSGRGLVGPLLFTLAYVAATLLLAPGSVLNLAAGAVFGLVVGTALVTVASTASAAAAFVIARYVAREKVAGLALRGPRFAAVDEAIASGGWRVVGLLRLSHLPFGLSNYLFGLTRVTFWPYTFATLVALLPSNFFMVYLGYAGLAGASAAAGETARTPLEWAFLGVGLVATTAAMIYVTQLARRAIAEHIGRGAPEEAEPALVEERARAAGGLPLDAFAAALFAAISVAGAVWVLLHRQQVAGLFG